MWRAAAIACAPVSFSDSRSWLRQSSLQQCSCKPVRIVSRLLISCCLSSPVGPFFLFLVPFLVRLSADPIPGDGNTEEGVSLEEEQGGGVTEVEEEVKESIFVGQELETAWRPHAEHILTNPGVGLAPYGFERGLYWRR